MITRHARKQKSTVHTKGEKSIKNQPKLTEMSKLSNKGIKTVIITNILKKVI